MGRGVPGDSWAHGYGPKERSWPEEFVLPPSSLRVYVKLESSIVYYLIARYLIHSV